MVLDGKGSSNCCSFLTAFLFLCICTRNTVGQHDKFTLLGACAASGKMNIIHRVHETTCVAALTNDLFCALARQHVHSHLPPCARPLSYDILIKPGIEAC